MNFLANTTIIQSLPFINVLCVNSFEFHKVRSSVTCPKSHGGGGENELGIGFVVMEMNKVCAVAMGDMRRRAVNWAVDWSRTF